MRLQSVKSLKVAIWLEEVCGSIFGYFSSKGVSTIHLARGAPFRSRRTDEEKNAQTSIINITTFQNSCAMFGNISSIGRFGATRVIPTKQEILDELAEAIQKKWGKQAIRRGDAISTVNAFPPLPTSISRLDAALGGGVLRGRITEFYGVRTSGVTTLALKIIAAAQAQEERAVYADPVHTFNPKYAAAYHINLHDLLVVRPPDPIMGFEIAADLVNRYSAGLFIFGHAGAVEDVGEAALRRVINAVRRSSCAFIFLNRARTPDVSPFHAYAATRLQMRRVRWLDRWGTVGGYLVKVTVVKQNGRDCQRTVTLRFDLPEGRRAG